MKLEIFMKRTFIVSIPVLAISSFTSSGLFIFAIISLYVSGVAYLACFFVRWWRKIPVRVTWADLFVACLFGAILSGVSSPIALILDDEFFYYVFKVMGYALFVLGYWFLSKAMKARKKS